MIVIRKVRTGKEFHQHDAHSDGSGTPAQRAKLLKDKGVEEASLTNHDTVKGTRAFIAAAAALDIRATTGIEITARLRENAVLSDVHVLGFAFALRQMSQEFCRDLIEVQTNQGDKIKKRCGESERDPLVIEAKDGRKILELQMPYDKLLEQLKAAGKPNVECGLPNLNDGVMCGPIADMVNQHFGLTDPAKQLGMHTLVNIMKGREAAYEEMERFLAAHDVLLARHCQERVKRWLPAGFTPSFVPAKAAVEHIIAAGGIAVPAHPLETNLTHDEINTMVGFGIKGLEVYTPKNKDQVAHYLEIALALGLVPTIGTDFHGPTLTPSLTVGEVPYCVEYPGATIEQLERLARAA